VFACACAYLFFFSFPFSEKNSRSLPKFAPNNSHCVSLLFPKKKRRKNFPLGRRAGQIQETKYPLRKWIGAAVGGGGRGWEGLISLSFFSRWKTETVAMGGKFVFLFFSWSFGFCGSENKEEWQAERARNRS